MPALKPRYEAFCLNYLAYANATEAARAAGYAFESAAQQGSRLLRRPNVVQRLAELRAELVARECQGDAQLAKLEIAFRAALKKDQPGAAGRIAEIQTKLAVLLGKAGLGLRGAGESLPAGAEPTRAALTRIARVLGVAVPDDGVLQGGAPKSAA